MGDSAVLLAVTSDMYQVLINPISNPYPVYGDTSSNTRVSIYGDM
jgi:hypothetical protein